MNHGDGGNCQRLGFLGQGLILRAALEQRESAKDNQQDHEKEKERENPPAFDVLRLLMFRIHRNTASHHGPNNLQLPYRRISWRDRFWWRLMARPIRAAPVNHRKNTGDEEKCREGGKE